MGEGLKRRIGPVVLTLYGIGIMVGAGIYVLTGAAAGAAGMWAPVAFLLAGVIAIPSALSFAELSARIPEAAGDSAYIEHGLGLHWLAVLVGLVNVVVGTVAAAAVLRGGVGYLLALVDIPFVWGVVGLGVALTVVALIGVMESLSFAAILTLIEVTGLGMVIWAGANAAPVEAFHLPMPDPEWGGIALATIFAFFALIGFDDIVNMAEETRNPGRNLPIAVMASLAVTALLYALVSLAAVRAVPREVLAGSDRPLALVWEAGSGQPGYFLSAIAVAAALNGVLAQIVLASRVLYGLGKRSVWLTQFRRTNAQLGTPVLGTLLIGAATIAAALVLPVSVLAEGSTLALLVVFAIVNASLIGVKHKRGDGDGFTVPVWMPWLGVLSCVGTLVASLLGRLG